MGNPPGEGNEDWGIRPERECGVGNLWDEDRGTISEKDEDRGTRPEKE